MAQRPGVMIYFDLWEPLLKAGDETVGGLLRAALMYAKYGELPELSGVPEILWEMLRPVIDRDGEAYEKRCESGRYAAYCREQKNAGREPVSFDEWYGSLRSDTVRCQ